MNQYRHSKSSLFLMEIILNILFFSILATFCVQIFFKGYQLSKSTEKLHQAVTACTSIAEICQSTDSPEETLSSIYPESMSLDATILIYYDRDFLAVENKTLFIGQRWIFYRISLLPSTSPFWIPALLKHFMNCQLPAISQFP